VERRAAAYRSGRSPVAGISGGHEARCVTHEQHQHHPTYAAAYTAAKTSVTWCTGCTAKEGEE
jgi:hypothetical protein